MGNCGSKTFCAPPHPQDGVKLFAPPLLTHSQRALFRVVDIGFGQIEDILGIILVKGFLKRVIRSRLMDIFLKKTFSKSKKALSPN